nr:TadE family protein [Novosphingobium marinum]
MRRAFRSSVTRSPKWLRRCLGETHGAVAVEFALVAPVFLSMVMGILDIAQYAYGQAVLRGAVEKAARNSSLEGANTATADAKVRNAIRHVLPKADVRSSRSSYFDFSDIGRPEQWNDANGNGTCDNDENFTDENGSGFWDPDIGEDGNGGANDVVVYRVEVTYKPVFPVPYTTRDDGLRVVSASAVKKNQPFANQDDYGSDVGTCVDP